MNANKRESENDNTSSIRVHLRPFADSYNPDVLSCLVNLSSDEVVCRRRLSGFGTATFRR